MVPMLLTNMLARLQLQFGSLNLCFLLNNATVSQLSLSLTKVAGEHTSKVINVKESLTQLQKMSQILEKTVYVAIKQAT